MSQRQQQDMMDFTQSLYVRSDHQESASQVSPAQVSPAQVSPASRDRNLFADLVCLPDKSQPGVAVPTSQDNTSTYMDSTIQPSPKDSGVDISSPERKIDELGDLSSQESSPRIADPTPVRDTGQLHPKYADIGNIQAKSSNMLYMTGMQNGGNIHSLGQSPASSVSNSNVARTTTTSARSSTDPASHDSGNESSHEIVCVGVAEDDDGGGLLDPGDIIVDPTSNTGFSVLHHSTSSTPPGAGLSSPGLLPGGICHLGDNLAMDIESEGGTSRLSGVPCTLTQLNMSQKSEADLQAYLPGNQSYSSSSESNYHDEDEDTNLFSALTEDALSFSADGSPTKKLYMTPQSTPRGSKCSTPSASKVSTPVRSTPSSGPSQMSGFLSEFEKFLQQSKKPSTKRPLPERCVVPDIVPAKTSTMPIQSKRSLSYQDHSVKAKKPCRKDLSVVISKPANNQSETVDVSQLDLQLGDVPTRGMFSVTKKVSTKTPSQKTPHDKPTTQPSRRSVPVHKDHVSEQQKNSNVKHESLSRCPKSVCKKHKFNVKRFMKADKKVMQLRREALKFLKLVFPDVDYPCSKRSLCTVDVLLSQVVDCVLDRQHVNDRLQVIPSRHDILDVRILVCKSPQACLRNLRRKIFCVLQAVLPDIDLRGKVAPGSEQVDALLKEVIHCNKSS